MRQRLPQDDCRLPRPGMCSNHVAKNQLVAPPQQQHAAAGPTRSMLGGNRMIDGEEGMIEEGFCEGSEGRPLHLKVEQQSFFFESIVATDASRLSPLFKDLIAITETPIWRRLSIMMGRW